MSPPRPSSLLSRARPAAALLSTLVLALWACGDPPSYSPPDPDDAGQDAERPQDADGPDLPPDPDDADADEPDTGPDLEPLVCPEVELEGYCVAAAFLGPDGGPLAQCPPSGRSPLADATDATCAGAGCRGPGTAPGALYQTTLGAPVHAPVDGTVMEAVAGFPIRPSSLVGCGLDPDGLACCNERDGIGNRIVIKDRKSRLWTLAHLGPALSVSPGQWVRAGQPVAQAGDTGFVCAPIGQRQGRVFVSVSQQGTLHDPSACLLQPGGGVAPARCRDQDRDTYGVGPDCDAQDCDDDDEALQGWARDGRGCLGRDGLELACADRDGDGAYGGALCPWPDEDCDDADPQTTSGCDGTRCTCLEGPCCDGCVPKEAGVVCAESVQISYDCPQGAGCGQPQGLTLQDRTCAGDSPLCDGPLVAQPEREVACSAELTCRPNTPACTPDPACAVTCQDHGDCLPAQHCDQGTCRGDRCPQGERFCAGPSLRQCDADGASSQELELCALGCDQGQCLRCPTGLCAQQGPGAACDGRARVVCAQADDCVVEAEREVCDDLCAQGACVQCEGDDDCTSTQATCQGGQCQCQHTCQPDEAGCLPDGTRWRCVEDEGGCRRRQLDPCGPQARCVEDGQCEAFCADNLCQRLDLTEGAVCDGPSAVTCGVEGMCAVEVSREVCRGDARVCQDGRCAQCFEDADCPSDRQRCQDNACVCKVLCSPEETGCQDDTSQWTCTPDAQGCFGRRIDACDPGQSCQDGACQVSCDANVCTEANADEGWICDGQRRVRCHVGRGCQREASTQRCGCGCQDGECLACDDPDGPFIVLGVGDRDFNEVADGDTVGIYPGFQGGYHVFGALRAYDLPVFTGTQQSWRIFDGPEELASWGAFRDLVPGDGFAQWAGETVQLRRSLDPRDLDGRRVTLSVSLVTLGNETLYDEVEIILAWPAP